VEIEQANKQAAEVIHTIISCCRPTSYAFAAVGLSAIGPIMLPIAVFVTTVCAKRTGAAISV
jgi:hypothetical protein